MGVKCEMASPRRTELDDADPASRIFRAGLEFHHVLPLSLSVSRALPLASLVREYKSRLLTVKGISMRPKEREPQRRKWRHRHLSFATYPLRTLLMAPSQHQQLMAYQKSCSCVQTSKRNSSQRNTLIALLARKVKAHLSCMKCSTQIGSFDEFSNRSALVRVSVSH